MYELSFNKSHKDIDMSILCSDPELEQRDEELFNLAEQWLAQKGIKTRTEYNNILPTYNLFLEIGKYLKSRRDDSKDE